MAQLLNFKVDFFADIGLVLITYTLGVVLSIYII